MLSTLTALPTKDKGSDKGSDKEKYHKEKMQFVNVSLRPSRLNNNSDGGEDGDDEDGSSSSSSPSLEVGSLVSAFVANVSLAKGCFLRLPGGGTGQVLLILILIAGPHMSSHPRTSSLSMTCPHMGTGICPLAPSYTSCTPSLTYAALAGPHIHSHVSHPLLSPYG